MVISGEIRVLAYLGPNQIQDAAAEPHALVSAGQVWLLTESAWVAGELWSPAHGELWRIGLAPGKQSKSKLR